MKEKEKRRGVKMITTEKFTIKRSYSKLDRLQNPYTVEYHISEGAAGCILSVERKESNRSVKEMCVCPNLNADEAKSLILYLYENSIGVYNWLDVLNDFNIRFDKID